MGSALSSVPVLRVYIDTESPLPGDARHLRTRVMDLGLPRNLLPPPFAGVTAAIVGWRGHTFPPLPYGLHYMPGQVLVAGKVPVYTSRLPLQVPASMPGKSAQPEVRIESTEKAMVFEEYESAKRATSVESAFQRASSDRATQWPTKAEPARISVQA